MHNKGFSKILILFIIVVIIGMGFLAWQMGWISKIIPAKNKMTPAETVTTTPSFKDKLLEIYNLNEEIANGFSDELESNCNIQVAVDKANNKDYSGALAIINQSLSSNTDLISKVNLCNTKVDEWKNLAENLQDQGTKTVALRVAELYKSRDESTLKIFGIFEKRLNLYKKSYTDAITLKQPSLISQTQENVLVQEFVNEAKNLKQIGIDLQAAEAEFTK